MPVCVTCEKIISYQSSLIMHYSSCIIPSVAILAQALCLKFPFLPIMPLSPEKQEQMKWMRKHVRDALGWGKGTCTNDFEKLVGLLKRQALSRTTAAERAELETTAPAWLTKAWCDAFMTREEAAVEEVAEARPLPERIVIKGRCRDRLIDHLIVLEKETLKMQSTKVKKKGERQRNAMRRVAGRWIDEATTEQRALWVASLFTKPASKYWCSASGRFSLGKRPTLDDVPLEMMREVSAKVPATPDVHLGPRSWNTHWRTNRNRM